MTEHVTHAPRVAVGCGQVDSPTNAPPGRPIPPRIYPPRFDPPRFYPPRYDGHNPARLSDDDLKIFQLIPVHCLATIAVHAGACRCRSFDRAEMLIVAFGSSRPLGHAEARELCTDIHAWALTTPGVAANTPRPRDSAVTRSPNEPRKDRALDDRKGRVRERKERRNGSHVGTES
jgi:hypothetical protein